MPQEISSGCINHPAIEAVARCKQCMKPVCKTCIVDGPMGKYCSASCKEKHEMYVKKAQDAELTRRKPSHSGKIKELIAKLIILLVVLAGLGAAAAYFDVPVVGDMVRQFFPFIPVGQ
jgi:hypothetical protein